MRTWLDLTDRFPVQFDVERMKTDLVTFQNSAAWLTHYDHALSQGWRAILLKSKNGDVSGPTSQYPSWDFSDYRRTPYADDLPYFRELMDQIQLPAGPDAHHATQSGHGHQSAPRCWRRGWHV